MIIESGRVFAALRKDASAKAAGRSAMYHAVTPGCRIALCTTEPGAASGWAEQPSETVTCRICLGKLERLRSRGFGGGTP
jgi:hypothetical protein